MYLKPPSHGDLSYLIELKHVSHPWPLSKSTGALDLHQSPPVPMGTQPGGPDAGAISGVPCKGDRRQDPLLIPSKLRVRGVPTLNHSDHLFYPRPLFPLQQRRKSPTLPSFDQLIHPYICPDIPSSFSIPFLGLSFTFSLFTESASSQLADFPPLSPNSETEPLTSTSHLAVDIQVGNNGRRREEKIPRGQRHGTRREAGQVLQPSTTFYSTILPSLE